jgi:fimbrial isopeptide formation D2 family protein/LPXTG-motif cell wall-anchored protein
MALSSASAETEKLAFSDDAAYGQNIIVSDPLGVTGRTYDLYQVFSGDLKDDALIDIDWGESIKNDSYDFSTELVEELKSATLLDGEDNTIQDYFKDVKTVKKNGEDVYEASTIASIVNSFENNSEALDTFASAVGDIIEKYSADEYKDIYTIQKRTQSTSTTDDTGSEEYIFNKVESGYYMVSEVTADSTLTYSKYMVHVGTKDGGTTIKAKANSGPTLDKNIKYGEDDPETSKVDESLHDYQAVAINDNVQFQLSSAVPTMNGYNKYYFIINDTLSAGLTYEGIESITVGGTTLYDYNKLNEIEDETEREEAAKHTYEVETTLNKDGTTSLQIIFKNFIQYKENTDAAITVLYNATVDEDIVVGETDDNTNTASLTYSNNPNYNYKGTPGDDDNPGDEDKPGTGEPTNKTPDETVYVYTAGINVIKVDNDGDRLKGAEFTIESADGTTLCAMRVVSNYKAVCYDTQTEDKFPSDTTAWYKTKQGGYTNAKYTTEDETSEEEATVSEYATENVKYSLVDDEYVADVENGTYYKTTGETPAYIAISDASSSVEYEQGYVLYDVTETIETISNASVEGSDPIKITGTVGDNGVVSFTGLNAGTYTITETKAPDGYNKLENPINVTITFTPPKETSGDWACTWTYSGGDDSEGEALVKVLENGEGVGEVKVTNLTTHTLPSTGGIGTTIFYTTGSLIAVAAAVLLITKRRMRREDEE